MRARYYDPGIGRFISEDPGRNGQNWYTYCNANSVGLVDATGRQPFSYEGLLAYAIEKFTEGGAEYAANVLRDFAQYCFDMSEHFGVAAGKSRGAGTGEAGLGGSFNSDSDLEFVQGGIAFLGAAGYAMLAEAADAVAFLMDMGMNPADLL